MRGWGFREALKYPLVREFRSLNTSNKTNRRFSFYIQLWPLYGLCIADLSWLTFSATRTLLYNPDVVLDHKNNPEPWQAYREGRYRVMFLFFVIQGDHRNSIFKFSMFPRFGGQPEYFKS